MIFKAFILAILTLSPCLVSAEENYTISYEFIDIKNNQPVSKKNANKYITIASVQKILTSFSALKILSPEYQFKTKAYIDKSKLSEGVYNGDLILNFTGSPDFGNKDIENLFQKLKSLGIERINGNIMVDDSIFDHHKYPMGAEADDCNFCYMSPITALAINKNCVSLSLYKKNNRILIDQTKQDYIPIDITSSAMVTKNINLAIEQSLELRYNENNNYDIFGNYYHARELPNLKIAIRQTESALLGWLEYYANQYSIKINKDLHKVNNIDYKNYQKIYTHKSRPLKETIGDVLLYSDNFISNILLKTMGIKDHSKPLSFKKSIMSMEKILSDIGVTDIIITGGAGFRTNINTANDINKVLLEIYKEPKFFSIFKKYLPLSGKYGRVSLDNKFMNLPTGYRILAKTGTLRNIYSLSGYILKGGKPIYAFTIAVNHFNDSKDEAFKIFGREILKVIKKSVSS